MILDATAPAEQSGRHGYEYSRLRGPVCVGNKKAYQQASTNEPLMFTTKVPTNGDTGWLIATRSTVLD